MLKLEIKKPSDPYTRIRSPQCTSHQTSSPQVRARPSSSCRARSSTCRSRPTSIPTLPCRTSTRSRRTIWEWSVSIRRAGSTWSCCWSRTGSSGRWATWCLELKCRRRLLEFRQRRPLPAVPFGKEHIRLADKRIFLSCCCWLLESLLMFSKVWKVCKFYFFL